MFEKAVEEKPFLLSDIPDQNKAQEMCEKAKVKDSSCLRFASDQYINREIFKKAVKEDPYILKYCPDMNKMCDRAVNESSRALKSVSDQYKTQEISKFDATKEMIGVPYWFKTPLMLEEVMNVKSNFKNGLQDISFKNLKRFEFKMSYYSYHDIHQNGGIGICQKLRNESQQICGMMNNEKVQRVL